MQIANASLAEAMLEVPEHPQVGAFGLDFATIGLAVRELTRAFSNPDSALIHLRNTCNMIQNHLTETLSRGPWGAEELIRHLSAIPQISLEPLQTSLTRAVALWIPQQTIDTQLWLHISREPHADEVAAFLTRLGSSAGATKAPGFRERVAEWLQALAASPSLRERCFAVAYRATEDCSDRLTRIWHDMQQARFIHDVEAGLYDNDLPGLVKIAREMFCLQEIEKIAVQKVRTLATNREELETHLVYLTGLHASLKLSAGTPFMAHEQVGGVTEDDLDLASVVVKSAENHHFHVWLSNWEPWRSALQRIEPGPYADTEQKKFEDLEGKWPRLVADELKAFEAEALQQNDEDTKRAIGKKVMDALTAERHLSLTRAVLTSRGLLSLLDARWAGF